MNRRSSQSQLFKDDKGFYGQCAKDGMSEEPPGAPRYAHYAHYARYARYAPPRHPPDEASPGRLPERRTRQAAGDGVSARRGGRRGAPRCAALTRVRGSGWLWGPRAHGRARPPTAPPAAPRQALLGAGCRKGEPSQQARRYWIATVRRAFRDPPRNGGAGIRYPSATRPRLAKPRQCAPGYGQKYVFTMGFPMKLPCFVRILENG